MEQPGDHPHPLPGTAWITGSSIEQEKGRISLAETLPGRIQRHIFPSHISDVLLRIGVKGLFTSRGTEIIFFPLVITHELSRLFIHLHHTDQIGCHLPSPQGCSNRAGGIYLLSIREREITVTELSAIARAASSGLNTYPDTGYSTPAAIGINAAL
jgi:hypothetical protein